MLLSKKDKEWLRKEIKEAVTEALTVEWTIEKRRDEKTGQPLATSEKKQETVFLPAVFVQLLPYYEGAMRGLHEDVSKNINKVNKMHAKIDTIGKLTVHNENLRKGIIEVKQLEALGAGETKQLDYVDADVIEETD